MGRPAREPRPGEVWRYSSDFYEITGVDQEKINRMGSKGTVFLRRERESGRIETYDDYPIHIFKELESAWHIVKELEPCPSCEENMPLPDGDYICHKCRWGV